MVAITTGGSTATMKSVTAEAQLGEIFDFLQLQEIQSDKNPTSRDNIQTNYDGNLGLFTGNFKLSYTNTSSTTGEVVIAIPNYLVNVAFSPGASTGTFKSTNPAQYLWEVTNYLRRIELNPLQNPNNKSNISIVYDEINSIVRGAVKLPFTLALQTDGSRKIFVNAYL